MATEKGERRRALLVGAAADLLRTGGFEAVRHRAVAEGGAAARVHHVLLRLLDDLVTAAAERTCRDELDEVRADLAALPPDAPPSALVELVLDQLLGPDSRSAGLDAVLLRYERLVATGRRPYLAPLMRATRTEFDALLLAILGRAGHQLGTAALHRLVAVVDGTVVNSLIEADPDPRAAARAALLAELDT